MSNLQWSLKYFLSICIWKSDVSFHYPFRTVFYLHNVIDPLNLPNLGCCEHMSQYNLCGHSSFTNSLRTFRQKYMIKKQLIILWSQFSAVKYQIPWRIRADLKHQKVQENIDYQAFTFFCMLPCLQIPPTVQLEGFSSMCVKHILRKKKNLSSCIY